MFEKQGFFSSQIEETRQKNLQDQSKLFRLAFRTLELAYDQLYQLDIEQVDKKSCLIGSLYCKIIESYNSVLLLSNYGLSSDSKSILRVFIEATFLLGSIVNDEEQYEQFLIKGDFETFQLVERIKKNPKEYSEELKAYVMNMDLKELVDIVSKYKHKKFTPKNMASYAKMNDVYYYVYHQLCEDVHTNVKSLLLFLEQKDDLIAGINPLPKYKDQQYVLISAIWILIRIIKDLGNYFNIDNNNLIKELEDELKPYLIQDIL